MGDLTPTPEFVKYQPAANIELLPCAYITGITGAVLKLSNVDGFAISQTVTVYHGPNHSTLANTVETYTAKSSAAVVKSAKTLELSAAPGMGHEIEAGDTIFGPTLVTLGGTNGGVQFSAKPDTVMVEYDQVEGDVDVVFPHWTVEAKFNLMEFDLEQWGEASQMGYRLVEAGAGILGMTVMDTLGDRTLRFGARFSFQKQDPSITDLFDRVTLWKVASIEGIDFSATKRDPSMLPVTLHALADPQRPRGNRFWQVTQETTEATA